MRRVRRGFVTCGEMKILERRADERGLSYYQMMENAGTRAAENIIAKLALQEYEPGDNAIRVFCGKGNNGGDGFVVARKLLEAGYDVTVILVDGEPVTTDSITNFGLIKDKNIKILDMNINDRLFIENKCRPVAIIDAIYGTGFHGSLAGNALKAAFYINRLRETMEHCEDIIKTKTFALDIPSGLSGDLTEEEEQDANSIIADYTITFHAKKPVHLQKFAVKYCGEIMVADIGIDEETLWNVEV